MGIFDLFSKRQARRRGEVPDVYQYTDIPKKFRVQVAHILRDAFGDPGAYQSQTQEYFQAIHDVLCREYGVFKLVEMRYWDPRQAVCDFMLNTDEYEQVLDVIEISFRLMERLDHRFKSSSNPKMTPVEAVTELNERFREHGIGFQFEASEIMRVDSQLVHSQVVKPTLVLLSDPRLKGANEEFLKAHEHYRNRRDKECLNECLKSFESTMKAICDIRKWAYSRNDTAKKLIDVCFQNGLVPAYLQSQFSSLRAGLESGIPTVRNRLGGHGQGATQVVVPQYLAGYLLHLTATTILFLVEAEKNSS